MRSGDQNWVSVSRAIKPFAEPGRPPDWFSQKHCASQYSELLETTETPKRKRGEKGEVVETVEDVIVRKLTAERVEELKKVIKETQEKYRRLKRDAELIQAGHMDSRLDELCNDIVMWVILFLLLYTSLSFYRLFTSSNLAYLLHLPSL